MSIFKPPVFVEKNAAGSTRERLLSNSGLLLPRPDRRAGFYHLSFQDFLAAQRLLDKDESRLLDIFVERANMPHWRNCLSFVYAELLSRHASPDLAFDLLGDLVEKLDLERLGLAVVVADCLQILEGRRYQLADARLEGFKRLCLQAIEREEPLAERHLLGLALGRLGDLRIQHDLRDRAGDGYIQIQAGSYLLGDEKIPYEIKTPFLITRYPITNSQFMLFLNDQGYENQKRWSEAGWAWREEQNAREPRYWRHNQWNGLNQPVVGVTFYEAEAFCRWAGGRLPTEQEWEAAARGPEGPKYPWGDPWRDGICNTEEAKLGVTTSVGLFPKSCSTTYKLDDAAGNVWEWCDSPAFDDRPSQVLRGGSWSDQPRSARCASRDLCVPNYRRSFVGFRIVRAQSPEVLGKQELDMSPERTPSSIHVFISYAHEDEAWRERFMQYLKPMVSPGEFEVWADREIEYGERWDNEIRERLAKTTHAILLVSTAFLNSEYIETKELPLLLQRHHQEDGLQIIPVLLETCLFEGPKYKFPNPKTGPEEISLDKLQMVSVEKPLGTKSRGQQNETLHEVARSIKKSRA